MPFTFLVNKLNGLCISISGTSTQQGAALVAWPQKPLNINETNDQLWEMVPSQPRVGAFIKTQLNENCITISNPSTPQGAALVSWPQKTSNNNDQLWVFLPGPSGFAFLSSLLNDGSNPFCISISDMSTQQGAALIAWPQKISNNDDQLWKVVPSSPPMTLFFHVTDGFAGGAVPETTFTAQQDTEGWVYNQQSLPPLSSALWQVSVAEETTVLVVGSSINGIPGPYNPANVTLANFLPQGIGATESNPIAVQLQPQFG